MVLPEVLEECLVRLVGNEPQRQLPQGDEVVGAEEVSQGWQPWTKSSWREGPLPGFHELWVTVILVTAVTIAWR